MALEERKGSRIHALPGMALTLMGCVQGEEDATVLFDLSAMPAPLPEMGRSVRFVRLIPRLA